MLDRLSAIRRALLAYGFTPSSESATRHPAFRGRIQAAESAHEVIVEIPDSDILALPVIKLTRRPPDLPAVVPHLSADNQLCYIARGTLALDIFDPAGQVLACVDEAAKVLDRVLKGDTRLDAQEEFFAYWDGYPVLIEVSPLRPGIAKVWRAHYKGDKKLVLVVGSDEDSIRRKYKLLGIDLDPNPTDIHIIQGTSEPYPSEGNWPPHTVGQFLEWLRTVDPACATEIKLQLDSHVHSELHSFKFVVITPGGWYGGLVEMDRIRKTAKLKRNSGTQTKNLLRHRRNTATLMPLSPVRTDAAYVISRNLPPGRKSLVGLSIILVGCGTIGGYLADMLAKSGAGSEGGRFVLVDLDTLKTSNLGRHRLGMRHLYRNKAEALAEELRQDFPFAVLEARPVDVREVVDLSIADLIIDATGEESLSDLLNHRFRGKDFRPMLFTWAEGAGSAVQAFLRDESHLACYRCLRNLDRSQRFSPLLDPLLPIHIGNGCEGYFVPFPATASVQAAALACEIAMDWANGKPSPRLRTRRLLMDTTIDIADIDPDPVEACPGCKG